MSFHSRSAIYVFCFIIVSQFSAAFGQLNLPGFGSNQNKQQADDQKVNKLLHDNLPLVLDANTAYPTVPNDDLLGGPFNGRVLPITLDTLTKPLPPGDYVIPMTFFCSEYSIHRGGQGTAYTLGPAQGTSAKAISTLLWRGMLTGHSPQELQSVSWAIQASVPYDKMPFKYKALVDQLIPEMKNQVNGQGFANIETGYQGMINKGTKKVSDTLSKGLGAITGGRGRVEVKVDVELNGSFARLGRLGQMALDGESVSSIVTASFPSDQAREQALYAGQGQQLPPLPAANGPWSVRRPGVAYMRFVVHGGNLQGNNEMQIRILAPQRASTKQMFSGEAHFVTAAFSEQTTTNGVAAPSLVEAFGGTVDQTALAACTGTSGTSRVTCTAKSIAVAGMTGYSVGGAGAQAPIMTPSTPLSANTGQLRIAMGGTDITGSTQTVAAGQPIQLNVEDASSTIISSQWSVDGDTVGAYNTSAETGTAPKPDFTRSGLHYYWTGPGQNLSVKVESKLNNGQTESASATFDVSVPQGVSVTPELGKLFLLPNPCNDPQGVWVMFGEPCSSEQVGIRLRYEGSSTPAGSYEWFQFILQDIDSYPGTPPRKCVVDVNVPYGGSKVNWPLVDSPGQPLTEGFRRPQSLTERSREFKVRSYLMWKSSVAGSIPVSLGYIEWEYSSDVVHGGGNAIAGSWKVKAFSKNAGSFQSSFVLPLWTTLQKSTSGRPLAGTIQGTCPP